MHTYTVRETMSSSWTQKFSMLIDIKKSSGLQSSEVLSCRGVHNIHSYNSSVIHANLMRQKGCMARGTSANATLLWLIEFFDSGTEVVSSASIHWIVAGSYIKFLVG